MLIPLFLILAAALTRLPSLLPSSSTTNGPANGPSICATSIFSTFSQNPITVTTTTRSKLSTPWSTLTLLPPLCPSTLPSSKLTHDPETTFQRILGFGGAFTESAALNYMSLSEEGREDIVDLLFGKDGLGYNLGRTHINSCDFSTDSYSFSSTPNDFNLTSFDTNLTHDQKDMIPFMLEAGRVLKEDWGEELKIIASPWSPPKWMKKRVDNKPRSMLGSTPETCLRSGSEYAESWALYFSKFLTGYKNIGINLFAITIQNEPEFAAPWEACSYTPETELEFLNNHLGPRIKSDHPEVKILGFDHNKDHILTWSETLNSSPYLDGIGYHWYAGGMDRLLDGAQGTANLNGVSLGEGRFFLGTEACHCPSTSYSGGDLKVGWSRAERNVHAILADLRAGSVGSIEWNLVLGGPNHLGNVCDAPILSLPDKSTSPPISLPTPYALPPFEILLPSPSEPVGDTWSPSTQISHGSLPSVLKNGVLTQPMYWTTGHISRFLRSGSKPIKSLIEGRNIFKKKGGNDLARVGVEVTFWPCEGSERQDFFLEDYEIKVKSENGFVCVGNDNDPGFRGLLLTKCDSDLIENQVSESGKFKIEKGRIFSVDGERCLGFMELKNGGNAGGIRGGSQLAIFEDFEKVRQRRERRNEATRLYVFSNY
ncbi:hypothetical protein TL16_g12769 [Triparma laevis f. inornata]|uniref:Glycosyl hydrolase family 30 TIM-barrel domain-containing protein n=1 Tax=Triparma laevis f. inornata TaxID=1714386 RepID=A0A9W7BT43_9STRA|nr:hypothetical protein TL16_g12769 [Triparma laevis f. inornata]